MKMGIDIMGGDLPQTTTEEWFSSKGTLKC